MNIPSSFLHFCDAIWEYRVSTNEVLFHNDTMERGLLNRWLPYDAVDSRYQEKYVYPLDLDIWRRYVAADALRRFCGGMEQEEHFYIRLSNEKKGMEWHEVYINKLDDDRLMLISRDTQDMQRSSTIAKAVVPEFDYVCRIELRDGSYVLYYSDEHKTLVPQSSSENYELIMEQFNEMYVVPEEAAELTERMRLKRVLKELEDSPEYILYATMQDKNSLSYKKLRFSYEDASREHLLLTRTDVGALMGERKLRERERAKRLEYLENMPVAFCSIKVLLNDEGQPYDFQFAYCNRAHEELEGVKSGELLGKNFYEFFKDTDPKWLKYYYDTAYKGIAHVIRSYSPEIKKYLLIYTFCMEPGHCECVLLDVSEQHFLIRELEHNRENMKRILETTTDQVFQYLPERDEVIMDGRGSDSDSQQYLDMESLRELMLERELLHPESWAKLNEGFLRIKGGEHNVSVVLQGGRCGGEAWKWYRVTMFDFQDGYTHERRVFGFMQNIDEFKLREEVLRKRAEQDSLTGVLNAGAGRQLVSQLLDMRREDDAYYHAMMIIDMDGFKQINDTMGHMAGDEALIELARILRTAFRAEDVIYRLGGDEFVVFVEKLHDADQSVQEMLHRLMARVGEAEVGGRALACSVGALVTNRLHSFEECYAMADGALYEAKRSGKGRFCIKQDFKAQPPACPLGGRAR